MRTERLALRLAWNSSHINQSKLLVGREWIKRCVVHCILIYMYRHVPLTRYFCIHAHSFSHLQIQEHRDAVELKIQTGVITSPIAKPQATSKPAASKPPPVSSAGGEEGGGGGGDALMVSFDEPSKPVKRKPPVLSSQRKKAAAKDDEGESPKKDEVSGEDSSMLLSFDEPSNPVKKKPQLSSERRAAARKKDEEESPKKDEDAEENSSLSVSFDEPSKPVKKKPALSSQKKAAAQKKVEEEESGSPSATPESKPKQSVSPFSLWYAHTDFDGGGEYIEMFSREN